MNIYSTAYMATVIGSLIVPSTWLTNNYFPMVQVFDTETIMFDKITKKRRAAPFVSPLVEGKVMESLGRTTDTFTPAYIKPKTILDNARPLKRLAGEALGGVLSPLDRLAYILAFELQDHRDMIDLRLELMAAEALRTGKITVSGEKYATQIVDFGRDPALTVTLTGTARWGQSAAKPLENLQTWAGLTLKKSGAATRDVTMDIDAWNEFRKDADVKAELALFRGNSTMVSDGVFEDGGVFMGKIQGFNIFVYSGLGEDDEPILPSGTVIMASPTQLAGVRAFGAIRDEESGYIAMAYFPKSWTEQDPSGRIIMTQSAPLLVPGRVNASFCATVL